MKHSTSFIVRSARSYDIELSHTSFFIFDESGPRTKWPDISQAIIWFFLRETCSFTFSLICSHDSKSTITRTGSDNGLEPILTLFSDAYVRNLALMG